MAPNPGSPALQHFGNGFLGLCLLLHCAVLKEGWACVPGEKLFLLEMSLVLGETQTPVGSERPRFMGRGQEQSEL